MQKSIARCLFAAIAGMQATAVWAYPTTWTIHNDTAAAVTMSCRSTLAVGNVNIVLDDVKIAARSRVVHDWGVDWYNDGLGLNQAAWSCMVDAAAVAGGFTTGWDEALTLRVASRAGVFVVAKVSGKGSVAAKAAAGGTKVRQ